MFAPLAYLGASFRVGSQGASEKARNDMRMCSLTTHAAMPTLLVLKVSEMNGKFCSVGGDFMESTPKATSLNESLRHTPPQKLFQRQFCSQVARNMKNKDSWCYRKKRNDCNWPVLCAAILVISPGLFFSEGTKLIAPRGVHRWIKSQPLWAPTGDKATKTTAIIASRANGSD